MLTNADQTVVPAERAVAAVDIPVIASLNGAVGQWIQEEDGYQYRCRCPD